jgi:hypothetical protein
VITPPPIPGLEQLGRTATRLHPRPAAVSAADSHVGGPLRWPAGEAWPVCDTPHMVEEEVPIPDELVARLRAAEARRTQPHVMADGEVQLQNEIARLVGAGFTGWGTRGGGAVMGHRYVPRAHPEPNPMLPLAQLRAADVPDLPRPGGADLLQVLWCPFDHDDDPWGPTLRLVWRREADVVDVLAAAPRGAVGNDSYVPTPCRLHPERVVEYPYPDELPDELRELADGWDGDYVDTFMVAGWKVGGYADWSVTDVLPTPCPVCAGATELLLVVASDDETDVTVGRWGSLRVFACLRCADTPFHLDLQ